ncbi:hypothetical protein [Winogradskyella pulchriflava]|uniref:Lipoprotein n=1 Tax=Winogradskyella pulchriflava TaxID=1110688 RepID=A0ABV6QC46_9FLAO
MRYFIGLLLLLFIASVSCEGRKSSSQALAEDVEEFIKNVTTEVDIYVPKDYTEREVDTLMNNGYSIKIKTYSDMENSVLFTKIKDTVNYQTYYRNFKFDILVKIDNKVIYDETFDKKRVNKALNLKPNYTSGSSLYNFDKLAVLKSIELNNDPTLNNQVVIDVLYEIPNSNKQALHQLIIDDRGKANFVYIK